MSDNPFIGPTYPLSSKPASVQQTVNLIPVILESKNERVLWAFKDVSGLVLQPGPTLYYTSWPYPLFADEAINADRAIPMSGQLWVQPLEAINADRAIPQSGTLLTQLNLYNNHREEAINADRAVPQSGTLVVQLHVYNDDLPNAINADRAVPQSGTLFVQLVTYDAPEQAINADRAIPQSGTLV